MSSRQEGFWTLDKILLNCWLLCMMYVCFILNHIACGALNGSIPLLVLYGITPDISIMLLYTFYQPVFYATHDQHFPSESKERAAFSVGFGEHYGDAMTHKLLDMITLKIICRSAVRPVTKSNPNHRLTEDGGEASTLNNQVQKSQLSLSDQDRMMLIHLTSSLC